MKRPTLRSSHLIALGIALLLGLWVASGYLTRPDGQEVSDSGALEKETVPSVRVREFRAEPVRAEVVVSGRTEAVRAVVLRAETEGRVMALQAHKGERVSTGAPIVRLDRRDKEARLAEAQAALKQRELQYQGAQRLAGEGYFSDTALAEAEANLKAARALVRRIEVELSHAEIRAPFDGVLETRAVEVGDFVRVGDEVARVLDTDPMLVVGHVTEQEVGLLSAGAPASARLATGQQVAGRLRYVASEADPATRTFRVELEVDNPGAVLAAGVTSEMRIALPARPGHFLSPALLALNEAGQVGVKTVDGEGRVAFHPVQLIRTTAQGVWVGGLPERVRIITVGQGFVAAGDTVRAVPEEQVLPAAQEPAS